MSPAADKTSLPPPSTHDKLLHDLNTVGYTILRSHIPPSQLQPLLDASRKLTAAARSGDWPYLRTCPKQFPPWPSQPGDEGIWGVQHLLHPSLYRATNETPSPPLSKEEAAAFAKLYFGDTLLNPIHNILSIPPPTEPSEEQESQHPEPLTTELLNLLISPPTHFALRWHRDSVPFSLSTAEEAAALGLIQTSSSSAPHSDPGSSFAITEHNAYFLHPAFRMRRFVQYNVPLLGDVSLHVVPGSHLRPRTEKEREALEEDEGSDSLPGWTKVELAAGDVVFYDSNLVHRGVYKPETEEERYTVQVVSAPRLREMRGRGRCCSMAWVSGLGWLILRSCWVRTIRDYDGERRE